MSSPVMAPTADPTRSVRATVTGIGNPCWERSQAERIDPIPTCEPMARLKVPAASGGTRATAASAVRDWSSSMARQVLDCRKVSGTHREKTAKSKTKMYTALIDRKDSARVTRAHREEVGVVVVGVCGLVAVAVIVGLHSRGRRGLELQRSISPRSGLRRLVLPLSVRAA